MSSLWHIASLLVQHRPQAAAAVDAALARGPGSELVLREAGRSIVLCEAADEAGLMDVVAELGATPGVFGVSLVHHHAEDAASLNEEIHP